MHAGRQWCIRSAPQGNLRRQTIDAIRLASPGMDPGVDEPGPDRVAAIALGYSLPDNYSLPLLTLEVDLVGDRLRKS